jgi:hypothetical protein
VDSTKYNLNPCGSYGHAQKIRSNPNPDPITDQVEYMQEILRPQSDSTFRAWNRSSGAPSSIGGFSELYKGFRFSLRAWLRCLQWLKEVSETPPITITNLTPSSLSTTARSTPPFPGQNSNLIQKHYIYIYICFNSDEYNIIVRYRIYFLHWKETY